MEIMPVAENQSVLPTNPGSDVANNIDIDIIVSPSDVDKDVTRQEQEIVQPRANHSKKGRVIQQNYLLNDVATLNGKERAIQHWYRCQGWIKCGNSNENVLL